MAKNKSSFLFLKRIFSGRSNQIFFLIAAIVLFGAILILIIYNFTFLISAFAKVLNPKAEPFPPAEFDIKGFEELNLIKK